MLPQETGATLLGPTGFDSEFAEMGISVLIDKNEAKVISLNKVKADRPAIKVAA